MAPSDDAKRLHADLSARYTSPWDHYPDNPTDIGDFNVPQHCIICGEPWPCPTRWRENVPEVAEAAREARRKARAEADREARIKDWEERRAALNRAICAAFLPVWLGLGIAAFLLLTIIALAWWLG